MQHSLEYVPQPVTSMTVCRCFDMLVQQLALLAVAAEARYLG